MSTSISQCICKEGLLSGELFHVKIFSKKVRDSTGEVDKYFLTEESRLWPNCSKISYSFLPADNSKTPPSDAQKAIVSAALTEYTRYANVDFVLVEDKDKDTATIRIAFGDTRAWSAVGTDALRLESGEPTMNLGNCSETDLSELALHEVGHVLGLSREQWFTNRGSVNAVLSDSDKAWLSLNYPGRIAISDGQRWTALHSLDVLKIPPNVASNILLSHRVSEKRFYYARYYTSSSQPDQKVKELLNVLAEQIKQSNINAPSEGADPFNRHDESSLTLQDSGIDQSVYDIIGSVVLNPQFRQTVTNIVTDDLPKHGINLSSYPVQSSADVQQGILGILTPVLIQNLGSAITGVVNQHGVQANTSSAYPLPDNVQQGIFDMVTSVLKNPIFTNIVTAAVKDVVTGLGSTTQA